MQPPKRRFSWNDKYLSEEKKILKEWVNWEISSNEAAWQMSLVHGLDIDNFYTAKEFEENANWIGWRR